VHSSTKAVKLAIRSRLTSSRRGNSAEGKLAAALFSMHLFLSSSCSGSAFAANLPAEPLSLLCGSSFRRFALSQLCRLQNMPCVSFEEVPVIQKVVLAKTVFVYQYSTPHVNECKTEADQER